MVKISKTKIEEWVNEASTLSQALPYMQKYNGKSITVKFGGAAMGEKELSSSFSKILFYLSKLESTLW